MRIKPKLLIIFLTIAFIPLLIFGILIDFNIQASVKQEALRSLTDVADIKEAEILGYIDSKKGRLVDFASDGFIREMAERINNAQDPDEKESIVQALNDHLIFNKQPLDKDIFEIYVLDLNGVVIANSREDDVGRVYKNEPYFLYGREQIYFHDAHIYDYEGVKRTFIALAAPLKHQKNIDETIGVLMIRYDLNTLNDILSGVRSKHLGAQTSYRPVDVDIYLISQNRLIIAGRQLMPDDEVEHWMDERPIAECINNSNEISGQWLGYHGETVFGATMCMRLSEDTKWILVVERSERSVLIPAFRLRNIIIFVELAVLFAVFIIAFFTARSFSKPIVELTRVAQRIAEGDTKLRSKATSNDEVGLLGHSLNQMANSLIKSTEEETRNIMEVMGEGLIAIDNKGRIMFMNHWSEKLLDVKAKDAIGKPLKPLLSLEDEKGKPLSPDQCVIFITLNKGKKVTGICRFIKNKKYKPFIFATGTPLVFKNKMVGAVAVYRDITKEREIDRAKSEFVSLASHQLQTPLTAIKWILYVMLTKERLNKGQRELVEDAMDSNNRMILLVDDLLNVSRLETGSIQAVSEKTVVCDFIEQLIKDVRVLAKEKKINIRIEEPCQKTTISFDRDLIGQVIINLLTNAIKYSDPNRTIMVTIKKRAKTVRISVQDQGIGIAPKDQERLFTKFFRTDHSSQYSTTGSGLGLYIIKKIMDVCHGKIKVTSKVGKGSTFTIILPLKGPVDKKRKKRGG